MPNVSIQLLGPNDAAVLERVADDVFDNDIHPQWRAEFFADPRHHLAVAIDDGVVVGMASGVRYVHPDKAPELFVNEVAVASTHYERGIGTRLMRALLDDARARGCVNAWVLTSPTNAAALALYTKAGGNAQAESPTMFEFPLAADA